MCTLLAILRRRHAERRAKSACERPMIAAKGLPASKSTTRALTKSCEFHRRLITRSSLPNFDNTSNNGPLPSGEVLSVGIRKALLCRASGYIREFPMKSDQHADQVAHREPIQFSGQTLTANTVTMSVFGAIVMFIVSLLSLFRLRRADPDMERPSRAPLYLFFPAFDLMAEVIASGDDGVLQFSGGDRVRNFSRAGLRLLSFDESAAGRGAVGHPARRMTDRAAARAAAMESTA